MQSHISESIHIQETPDGTLIKQALVGNQRAFETLVQRYNSSLFSFIYHFLGDYDQACDILQQVFLQLYLSLPSIRTEEPLKPWLFQVARNRCLDDIRQRKRRRNVHFSELETGNEEDEFLPLANIPDTNPLPEELAERHDLQQFLWQAIQTLPPKFRTVIFLRYVAQFSFSEIAQTLNMPTATAKTYFQRAKLLLSAYIRNNASQFPAR
ncbi:MAG TPA: RNA polymerase sigma factor [Ktedonobacteraceae bacterium]|nr:RNA polymerase sigma factor [Ktedonobacteraceae bacterium]